MSETWARSDAALWRRSGAALAVKLPWNPEIVALNESGQALWDALESPQTITQVAARLAQLYGVPASRVEQDLLPVLADLEARHLVKRVAA